jgi:hypothetical protein
MGNYLTTKGYATDNEVKANYLTKDAATTLYATDANFRAEVNRLVAEDSKLNTQHTDFVSGTFNPLSTEVGTLRTDVNGLRTNVDANNTAYTNWLEQTYKPLSTEVGSLRSDYNTLSSTVDGNNTAFTTFRDSTFSTAATDLKKLQGNYTTLNNNYNTHIGNYNKFEADINKRLGDDILTLENKFDAKLGKYATLAEVTNLNSAVESGLNAQEVAILKSVLNSTQIDDALTSLGVQKPGRTTTNATTNAQYLRHLKSRNYVIY